MHIGGCSNISRHSPNIEKQWIKNRTHKFMLMNQWRFVLNHLLFNVLNVLIQSLHLDEKFLNYVRWFLNDPFTVVRLGGWPGLLGQNFKLLWFDSNSRDLLIYRQRINAENLVEKYWMVFKLSHFQNFCWK